MLASFAQLSVMAVWSFVQLVKSSFVKTDNLLRLTVVSWLPSANVMFARLLQFSKTYWLILTTPAGIATLVNPLPLNA